MVSRLSVGDGEFWVSDESPEHANFSPESLGGGTVRHDSDRHGSGRDVCAGLAAGATQITAVENAYGWRVGRIVDPFGHHWEIGKPLTSLE